LGITGMALDLILKLTGRIIMPWTKLKTH